ncbi:MAG: hypothetical protein DRO99_02590 [Candidatus Aenigmatarchaeota archaeon]|nr:MAG: hypothetical protein DRO99_02590 [Candidatus Aenigmarchaeota archaeon]
MRKGIIDLPIIFVGLLILTVIILLVLSLFGYNIADKVQDIVTNTMRSIAEFFTGILTLGG